MRIFEIGTGYTSIPARMGAATEIVVEELTRSMIGLGYDATILVIKDRKRSQTDLPIIEVYMPQFFSTRNVVKLGLVHKLKRVLYSISLSIKLKNLIKRLPADTDYFLHFHNQYNLFFFYLLVPKNLIKRCKVGYTVHSHIWFGEWNTIKRKVLVSNFQEIYCCKHADKVFVLNEVVARMLTDYCNVPSRNIKLVINGVNVNTYNENSADLIRIKEIKKKYNLENKKIALQVGSVCERKNQLGTLLLLTPVMRNYEDIAFAYAGGIIDMEYQQRIISYARENSIEDRVVYLGEISPGEELNIMYTMSDVCFMNSRSEAFALVIAEALSIPRPIFINEEIMNSLPFLLDHEGDGIIRIRDSFEKDIINLFKDSVFFNKMKVSGRSFIVNEYSWDKAAIDYLNTIKSLWEQ